MSELSSQLLSSFYLFSDNYQSFLSVYSGQWAQELMVKEEDVLGSKKKGLIGIYWPLFGEAQAWSEAIVTGKSLPYAKQLIFYCNKFDSDS